MLEPDPVVAEVDDAADAAVKAMFAAGEALARTAAGVSATDDLGIGEGDPALDVEEAQFDVRLDGLKGGVDLLAAPRTVRGADPARFGATEATSVARDDRTVLAGVAPDIVARFEVLVREVTARVGKLGVMVSHPCLEREALPGDLSLESPRGVQIPLKRGVPTRYLEWDKKGHLSSRGLSKRVDPFLVTCSSLDSQR